MSTFLGMPTAPRGVGHLRGDEPFPAAARRALADTQLRRNLGQATAHDPGQAGRGRRRGCRTGRSCARPAGRSRPRPCANLDRHLERARGRGHRARRGRALGARRRRGQPASSPAWSRRPARREVVKVKSMATEEIGLNEALAAAGITAYETDLAELIVQLGDDRPSHILVPGDPPQPGRDPRDLPARDGRRRPGAHRRPRPRWPRRPGCTCGGSSWPRRSASAGPTSRSPRPGRCAVVESEGNGRMCLTLPRDPDHGHGHREDDPDLAGPRGVPAAAAALVDRRADEPVHLDVDRGDAGRRPAGVPPGPARQRPDRRARRRDRPPGAALHPLLGLPERLPGLRAHRRPRLRLGLPRPDRRDPVAAADRRPSTRRTPRCPTRRRCAAPATTSAR